MPFTTYDKLGSQNGIFTKLQFPKGGYPTQLSMMNMVSLN